MSRVWPRVGIAWLALAACSEASQPPATTSALPDGVVARVGAELIDARTVGRIVESQHVAPREALSAAIFDALLASEAQAVAPPGAATSIARAATARSLLEQLAREAGRSGPPSEAELAEIIRERWLELDRPDAARTSHVLVLNDQPEKAAAARQLAEQIAVAVKATSTAEEFMRVALEVPHEGFELKAEALRPVTADGRTFERRGASFVSRGTFDADFARAANQLSAPGQLSPVIQSRFGFHIIRLEERIAGASIPRADQAAQLQAEVMSRRAGRARRELVEKLRKGAEVRIDRAHDELTAKPKFGS